MTQQLQFSVSDGIARIVLNRPQRMNAFNFEMIDAWTVANDVDDAAGGQIRYAADWLSRYRAR